MLKRTFALTFAAVLIALPARPAGTRLKEVASLEGVRDNQLMGYGVVVGLNGTGDKRQTIFSLQTLANILARMGVTVDPTTIQVRNIAGVMVTATLPPFAQPGTKIDITAAAIGDASNLQGGLLVMTPMKGADGQIYAVAQGPVMTGGFVAGRGGNTQTVNHPTVGRVPAGAIVERSPPSIAPSAHLKLQLHEADFTTAARIVDVLNRRFATGGLAIAKAESATLVSIDIPASYSTRPVEFVAEMENLTIEPDHRERIVINERTGTIVLGKDVRITPVAIMHGALSVEVRTFDVLQSVPRSPGMTMLVPETNKTMLTPGANTATLAPEINRTPLVPEINKTMLVPETTVNAKEAKAQNIVLQKGATVEELARALQAIGSTPRDVIAILQSMRAAGAIEAEIEGL